MHLLVCCFCLAAIYQSVLNAFQVHWCSDVSLTAGYCYIVGLLHWLRLQVSLSSTSVWNGGFAISMNFLKAGWKIWHAVVENGWTGEWQIQQMLGCRRHDGYAIEMMFNSENSVWLSCDCAVVFVVLLTL